MLNHQKTTLMWITLAIASLFSSANAHQHKTATQDIDIADAWVRSAPANAPALGAFMTIHNHTDQAVKLIAASADSGYDHLELHRTQQVDGMMKMVEQAFMPIPAQGVLVLKPGSWHVMLIQPTRVPKAGEVVRLYLDFDNGSRKTVMAKVKKGKMMMHHKSMH